MFNNFSLNRHISIKRIFFFILTLLSNQRESVIDSVKFEKNAFSVEHPIHRSTYGLLKIGRNLKF